MKNQLSGEASDTVNAMLIWRQSRPEEFVEKLGRLVWEVVRADATEDGSDDVADRMLIPIAAR